MKHILWTFDHDDAAQKEQERYFRISPEDDQYIEECTEDEYLRQLREDEERYGEAYEYDEATDSLVLTQEALEQQATDADIHDPYLRERLFRDG